MTTTFPDLERWSQTVDQRLDHLGNAVGDLSQGQRALAFDMREVKRDLHGIRHDLEETRASVSRIEQVQSGQGDLLRSHSESLQSHGEMLRSQSETLRSHGETLRSHSDMLRSQSETLRSHGEMLRTILARLGDR